MHIIYTGNTGSGKTYRCVSDILSKKIQEQYFIIHNIDGLKKDRFQNPDHVIDFNEHMQENGMHPDQFFTEDHLKKLAYMVKERTLQTDAKGRETYKRILLVVDEAYDYFSDYTKPKERFLSYHRHLGMRMQWMCIHINQIHFKYRYINNYEMRAKVTLPFCFLYQKYEKGIGCGFSITLKSKKVFQAYKSAELVEKKKPNPTWFILIGVILFFGYRYFYGGVLDDKLPEEKEIPAGAPRTPAQGQPIPMAVETPFTKSLRPLTVPIDRTWAFNGFIRTAKKTYHLIKNVNTGDQYQLTDIYPNLTPIQFSSNTLVCLDRTNKQLIRFVHLDPEQMMESGVVSNNQGRSSK